MSKPKVGFYWCASCGGCEEAVVDLNENILTVVEAVDIVFWPVALDFKKSDVEAMQDGEIDVCFINGAVRTSEQLEMAELLRRKAKMIVAFGSCAHTGGIPGLANLTDAESILYRAYEESPSTVNPEKVRPQVETRVPEGTVTLPSLDNTVKALDMVIPVEFYLPGCPPPPALILNAVMAILKNELPPLGSTLAPDMALCDTCPRKDSKPDKPLISEYKRTAFAIADPEKCLLAQGFVCLGPATRSGCDNACIKGNMPCTGCGGPISNVRDYGAKALSAIASLLDSGDDAEIDQQLDQIPDPVGTFNRYSLPASFLYRRVKGGS